MTRMICDKFPFGPSYQILNKCVQCRLYNIILWKLETIWFITWLSHYFIPFHHWIFQNRSKKKILKFKIWYISFIWKYCVLICFWRNSCNTETEKLTLSGMAGGIFFIFFIRRVLIYNQPSLSPCFPFFYFKFILLFLYHIIIY